MGLWERIFTREKEVLYPILDEDISEVHIKSKTLKNSFRFPIQELFIENKSKITKEEQQKYSARLFRTEKFGRYKFSLPKEKYPYDNSKIWLFGGYVIVLFYEEAAMAAIGFDFRNFLTHSIKEVMRITMIQGAVFNKEHTGRQKHNKEPKIYDLEVGDKHRRLEGFKWNSCLLSLAVEFAQENKVKVVALQRSHLSDTGILTRKELEKMYDGPAVNLGFTFYKKVPFALKFLDKSRKEEFEEGIKQFSSINYLRG